MESNSWEDFCIHHRDVPCIRDEVLLHALLEKAKEEGRQESASWLDNLEEVSETAFVAKIRQEEQDRILKIIDGMRNSRNLTDFNQFDGYQLALDELKSKIRD